MTGTRLRLIGAVISIVAFALVWVRFVIQRPATEARELLLIIATGCLAAVGVADILHTYRSRA